MEKNTVLEFHDINKSFATVRANQNIDLSIEGATIHSIVGENGAGKSTLMNLLAGIHKPDSGSIILNGKNVSFRNPQDAAKHGIGMVCQEFMLFPALSVLDNIISGNEELSAVGLLDKKRARKRIEQICSDYHFKIPIDTAVRELPVAVLQQVEIVKILYRGANIIILDEPTSVLTPQGIEGLFNAMRFLVSKGKTIIFITHKLREVLAVSDKISIMKNGKLVDTVLPSDVDERALARKMVGREVILTANKKALHTGKTLLHVENLSVKDADGVLRVKNVGFDVREGEIVGIAGVAGSGQTELIEALIGLADAQSGSRAEIDEKNILNMSIRDRRGLGIGYVPQNRIGEGVNLHGTLWESAIMGYHIKTGFKHKLLLDKEQIREFSEMVIDRYAVKTQGIDSKISELSGGNVQKLIVGRELLQNNRLLIIEDPTRGIDIGAIEFIWQQIIDAAASGVGVLMISHELNEVLELSDRILVMYDGELRDGRGHGELTEQQIGLLMLGGELYA